MHHSHTHHTHDSAPETSGRTIRWANHYDLFVQLLTLGRERAMRAEMIELAAIPSGAAVLDVGCGTGSLTLRAKAAGGTRSRVCGIDAAPEMITVARQKAAHDHAAVEFEVGVIEALPYADASFDLILSSLMFHHLPGDLQRSGLAEMRRVLKPGGRILIFDLRVKAGAHTVFSLINLAHHSLQAGVDELVPLVEQAGYSEVKVGSLRGKTLGYLSARRSDGTV